VSAPDTPRDNRYLRTLVVDLQGHTDIETAARDLARRESECSWFFTFEFDSADENVVMHIGVPQSQADVLDGLEARVAR
jgi:hypothetical protein